MRGYVKVEVKKVVDYIKTHQPGEMVEVPQKLAGRWIRDGFAVQAPGSEPVKVPAQPAKTATAPDAPKVSVEDHRPTH